MKKPIEVLYALAKTCEIPLWASHVAVRNDGSKTEPALWDDASGEYLDEAPQPGERWSGCYKTTYWTFFAKDELK